MKSIFLFIVGISLFTQFACKTDDPKPENPEELITTLNATFTPHDPGDVVSFTFEDPDGDGGIAPVITGGKLQSQSEYHLVLSLFNTAATPDVDVNEEILDEAEAHQFFFETTGVTFMMSYDDGDTNGKPLGIVTTILTGDAGTGTLKITLRHEPDKNAPGVADGDITNAGGDTDLEVVFPIILQ